MAQVKKRRLEIMSKTNDTRLIIYRIRTLGSVKKSVQLRYVECDLVSSNFEPVHLYGNSEDIRDSDTIFVESCFNGLKTLVCSWLL
jgi:hypothetical protein